MILSVNGFMSIESLAKADAILASRMASLPSDLVIWTGVGSSSSRLLSPSKTGKHSPSLDTLGLMLSYRPLCVKVALHFKAVDPQEIGQDIDRLGHSGLPLTRLAAIQVNAAWPPPSGRPAASM